MAEALYRKYRPQIFEDVVGQEPIERTLKNAIAQDKVSHAYLLCGPRGTGKTTTARLIAKALLCEKGPTPSPDGTCEDCQMIAAGTHPDVYELDAASRTGVENVREEIINRVQFAPTRGKFKVYVIDEVHMLSTPAFNALLKTLEEPPSHVVFVLCTTDPQKVPETILSRCQRFDFRPISPEAMVSRLGAICVSEDVEFEGEALDLIAHRAEGGMRNALTSLEQIIAFEDGKVTLAGAERILGTIDSNDMAEIINAIGKRDVAACFRWVATCVESGTDLSQYARDIAEHVRNMYIMTMVGDDIELDVSETMRRELAEERQMFGEDRLSRMLCVMGDLLAELKTSTNRRLSFEIALTRLVRPDSDLTIAALAERVEALESGHSAVAAPMPMGGVPQAAAVPVAAPAAAPAAATAPVRQAPAVSAMEQPLSDAQIKLQELQRERIYRKEEARQAEWRGGQQGGAPGSRAPQAPASASAPQMQGAPRAAQQAAAAPRAPQAPVAASVQRQAPVAPRPQAQASAQVAAAQAQQIVSGSVERVSDRLAQALLNPAMLQRVWQAALAAVKKQKTAYGVLFMNTRATFDSQRGRVVIEFPRENAFAFKSVQRPEVRDAIGHALSQAAGEPVAFELAQTGGSAGGRPAAPVARAQRPATAPLPAPTPAPRPAPAPSPVPAAQPQQAPMRGAAPAPRPAAQPFTKPAPTPAMQQPRPQAAPPVFEDGVVPYDDVVPYGDDAAFDAGYDDPGSFEPASYAQAPRTPEPAVAPAQTQAPASSGMEEPDDLQAMLQAGFGDGVVFEELK